jgi:hypothetical protein
MKKGGDSRCRIMLSSGKTFPKLTSFRQCSNWRQGTSRAPQMRINLLLLEDHDGQKNYVWCILDAVLSQFYLCSSDIADHRGRVWGTFWNFPTHFNLLWCIYPYPFNMPASGNYCMQYPMYISVLHQYGFHGLQQRPQKHYHPNPATRTDFVQLWSYMASYIIHFVIMTHANHTWSIEGTIGTPTYSTYLPLVDRIQCLIHGALLARLRPVVLAPSWNSSISIQLTEINKIPLSSPSC